MKSKKKNEMEKAQNTMEAAQELDMDALEDVAGGYVTYYDSTLGDKTRVHANVHDDFGKPVKWFIGKNKEEVIAKAKQYNDEHGFSKNGRSFDRHGINY